MHKVKSRENKTNKLYFIKNLLYISNFIGVTLAVENVVEITKEKS